MRSKLLSDVQGVRQWVVIFAPKEKVMAGLKRFAAEMNLGAAHFTGIGAFSHVTVAWFDLEQKAYRSVKIAEQVEVLSLLGDVARFEGKPSIHAHLCVAKSDGSAHGGHLQEGIMMPTLEVVVVESPAHLRKTFKPEFGIPLIDLGPRSAIRTRARAGSKRKA